MRALIAVVLLATATAAAEPAQPVPVEDPKRPAIAFALSAGTTLAGFGALAVGVKADSVPLEVTGATIAVIGPTLGHVYAGGGWNTGLGLRIGSGTLLFLGTTLAFTCMDECKGGGDRGPLSNIGVALAVVGGTIYLGAMAYEIGTAPGMATRYNREHHLDVTLVPTGNGLAVAGTF